MSSKKNIDRLFQEKFKEFDVKPDPKVWKNIESKLKKEKEEDRVVIIPFWLKLTGIAASLLLLFFLGNTVFNTTENTTIPSVVDSEKTKNSESNNSTDSNTTEATTSKDKLEQSKIASEEKESSNSLGSSTLVDTKNSLEDSKGGGNTSNKNNSKNNYYKPGINSNKLNNTVVSGNNSTKNNSNNSSNSSDKLNNSVSKTSINSTNNITNNSGVVLENSQIKDNISNSENSNPSKNDAIVITDTNKTEENNEKELPKPSIEDAIADSKNTEDLIEKEDVTNRWSVNTNIAPVYYNAFGEGSHIHEQFNENNKTGEINTSYGVKVGYALNDNITVRSGINKLNLSYDTDDVVVYEKLSNNSSLRNIDFSMSNSGQELNMISANNINIIEVSKSLNAGISQQMSYYEVPLEIEYKLLKKRIGINIIGGFSTFLLDNNQLVSQLNGVETKIGEANNINSVSFSTNLGVGIDYKVSKSVLFNLEPTFKYHLNAFNQTSGSFNPYIIGLYTGISYKF